MSNMIVQNTLVIWGPCFISGVKLFSSLYTSTNVNSVFVLFRIIVVLQSYKINGCLRNYFLVWIKLLSPVFFLVGGFIKVSSPSNPNLERRWNVQWIGTLTPLIFRSQLRRNELVRCRDGKKCFGKRFHILVIKRSNNNAQCACLIISTCSRIVGRLSLDNLKNSP